MSIIAKEKNMILVNSFNNIPFVKLYTANSYNEIFIYSKIKGALCQRYRTKSSDTDTSKKFIFNAKQLNPALSVAEAGLTDNANIFVVTTRGVEGAY